MDSNFSHGREAEDVASSFLRQKGFEILSQNWRTRYCEIDIVAKKKRTIYFFEVKYRLSSAQGAGLEYITGKKLNQMKLAAEFWVSDNDWKADYSLGAVEVSGSDYQVTSFLPEL